jgi:hypothetical protein
VKLEEITLSNIKSFFQGHARAYLDKISLLPLYTKEQVFYRIYVCRESCVPYKKCERCKCPALKKSYSTKSCSEDKFPDLMSQLEWEQYKINNGIDEETIQLVMEEVELIFKPK